MLIYHVWYAYSCLKQVWSSCSTTRQFLWLLANDDITLHGSPATITIATLLCLRKDTIILYKVMVSLFSNHQYHTKCLLGHFYNVEAMRLLLLWFPFYSDMKFKGFVTEVLHCAVLWSRYWFTNFFLCSTRLIQWNNGMPNMDSTKSSQLLSGWCAAIAMSYHKVCNDKKKSVYFMYTAETEMLVTYRSSNSCSIKTATMYWYHHTYSN